MMISSMQTERMSQNAPERAQNTRFYDILLCKRANQPNRAFGSSIGPACGLCIVHWLSPRLVWLKGPKRSSVLQLRAVGTQFPLSLPSVCECTALLCGCRQIDVQRPTLS